jgi:hypothetical protein
MNREPHSPAADEGLGAVVTDAAEQVEETAEECEGVRKGWSTARLGLIGVGVSGRRRFVTSPSGAGALRCRLTALELEGVVVWGLIGIAAASEGMGLRRARERKGEERRGSRRGASFPQQRRDTAKKQQGTRSFPEKKELPGKLMGWAVECTGVFENCRTEPFFVWVDRVGWYARFW